jgi:alcohol dehydrogenase class IV
MLLPWQNRSSRLPIAADWFILKRMRQTFTLSRFPELVFGEGKLFTLPAMLASRSIRKTALIFGGKSFKAGERYAKLISGFAAAGIALEEFSVSGEPSPEAVDGISDRLKSVWEGPFTPHGDCAIAAVGGGSVIDAAKAVSAMLTMEGPVADYLESVGTKQVSGTRVPFFAAPTTSGTGTEASKNAVLSRIGKNGFKKSLRHDNFVSDAAIIDPLLVLSCPPAATAASGLDAITQLVESYTSRNATPVTDALVLDALRLAGRCFPRVIKDGSDREARAGMAYAAYISGIGLAHAGLGIVHAIASPLGGMFAVPHGFVCGTLVAEATRRTVEKAMRIDDQSEDSVLKKYARAGEAFTGSDAGSDIGNAALLVDMLDRLTVETAMPRLGAYGLTREDVEAVVSQTDPKRHPVLFSRDEIFSLIAERL